jgi:selenocysteine lyase/cysteine desulfurase
LRLITTAGLENIEAHVLRLGDRFIAGVRSLGLPLVSEVEPAVRSGIVVAGRGRSSVEELQRRARQSNVQVTIRDTGVRFAPHGYNTDADVDRVLSILA